MSRLTSMLLVALLTAGTACSSDPTSSAPRQGTLNLRLTTPNADDGAILFTVHGPPIDTVLAANTGLRLFTRRADDSTLVGALVGGVASGTVVTLKVGDANGAAYTAGVTQVADRNSELRASLDGYGLTVAP